MSAWIVDKAHIDALLAVAVNGPRGVSFDQWYGFSWAETVEPVKWVRSRDAVPDKIGMMLWSENFASIHDRYPDTIEGGEYPGPIGIAHEHVLTYTWPEGTPRLNAVEALKATQCYQYQSCEHDGWETSEAKRFTDALKENLIGHVPGYDEAAWGITTEDLANAAQEALS